MRIGAVFPQLSIGADRIAIRDYALSVEGLGFKHIAAYDHVVGADRAHYEGWSGYYDHRDTFHEPLVLFGYLSAICQLEFATGILILPQRQTTLVAKQAAEVDILCDGRLRLGVGVGWNPVEYTALGERFDNRGTRIEEQIELLRALWSSPVVDFQGNYNQVVGAGIAPLPIQRPIPVWMGAGTSSRGLARVGRVADGWFSMQKPGPELESAAHQVREAAVAAGRNADDIGIEGRIDVGDGDLDRVVREIEGWKSVGASHVSFGTMRSGLEGIDQHVAALGAAIAATSE